MGKGFTLIEILLGCLVLFVLAGLLFGALSDFIQKGKIARTKAQISLLALALEQVKEDTGLYPVALADLLDTTQPETQLAGWKGPYIDALPLDSWNDPYFYKIPPTTLFSSNPMRRTSGPEIQNLSFSYTQNNTPGEIIVENYGVTSATISFDGVEVISESEFRKNPQPQIIEVPVTVQQNNSVVADFQRSNKNAVLYISIAGFIPTGKYFIVGSFGQTSGDAEVFEYPIEWKSDVYPNFLATAAN